MEEGENAQREKQGCENFGVRRERVTRLVGMDEHGIANATPCPRPIVPHSRADAPYDQGSGCNNKDGKDMDGQKIILPSHFENGDVNVIDAWRLRIHRRPIECSPVQSVVRDYSVIALIAIVQRRQERGQT